MELKTEFDTASFRKALALVLPAVAKTSPLPIISSVRVRTASLVGTDLQIQVTAAVDGVGDAIDVCLPADKLRAAASIASNKITMEVARGFCTIKAGKSRFKVPTLSSTDFPSIDEGEPDAEFDTTGAMHAAIGRVIYTAAIADVRYYLNGVFIECMNGVMEATATDGHGMASIQLGKHNKPFNAILTRAAAEMLSKAAPGRLGVSRLYTVLQNDDARIVAKNIDGTFPDWRRVFPSKTPHSITLPRAALIHAVGLSKLARDAKKNRPMKMAAADGVLTVTAVGLSGETIESEVPITDQVGAPLDVGVNGDLLEPMLKTASEEDVTLSWAGTDSALLTQTGTLRAVLMPMRV